MKLVSFRVQKFRNIIDSTEVIVQDDVTSLVGKNESGKTAALHALYRLNPAYGETFHDSEHYPRWLLTADRKAGVVSRVDTITGTFELDADDVVAVEDRFGKGVLPDRIFTFTRGYTSTRAAVQVDEAVAIAHFFRANAAEQATVDLFAGYSDLAAIQTAITDKLTESQATPGSEVLVAELQRLQAAIFASIGQTGSVPDAVSGLLQQRMPKFFYFGQYSLLPGRIDLGTIDAGAEGPGQSALQTARSLLHLADTTTASLAQEDYEERRAELEAVSNDLTDQVFEYWSQNEQLEVTIDVDVKPTARFLDIRVRDRRHNFTSNFSQRSAGFQWFFSFLAAFSEFEGKPEKVIVLLDEPGLALHAKAQADFLRFIDERLAPSVQVLYTTHSPFMVEAGKLERVRVVEDKGAKKGAVISSDVLTVSSDTLFPLQAALGYDIAQSLFIGPDNLLVEGTSDYTYLTVLSDHLRSLGRESLDESWRVLPAGGVTNVPAFVALMGRKLDVTVFVDSGTTGLQRLTTLATQGLLKAQRLITVDQVTGAKRADIEDLFAPADYLQLYNPAFGASLAADKLVSGDRIIDRISRTQGSDFTDHGKPADYLLRNRDKILEKLTDATLDNFEAAFRMINATKGT